MTYLKNVHKCFVCVWVCLFASQTNAKNSLNETNTLTVTPNRCVALRQGQVCYQKVTFSWQQPEMGNYCLVELSTLDNVKCWSQVKTGKVMLDFQSDKSTDFVLRKEGTEDDLALVNITVSWVYKSSRRPKSSWKLF